MAPPSPPATILIQSNQSNRTSSSIFSTTSVKSQLYRCTDLYLGTDGSEDLYLQVYRCDSKATQPSFSLTLAGRPLALKKDSSSRFPEILKQRDLKKTCGKSDFRLMDSANMFSAGSQWSRL